MEEKKRFETYRKRIISENPYKALVIIFGAICSYYNSNTKMVLTNNRFPTYNELDKYLNKEDLESFYEVLDYTLDLSNKKMPRHMFLSLVRAKCKALFPPSMEHIDLSSIWN